MRKGLLIAAGILMVLGVSAQVNEVSMDVMRARHAVDTLVQNDIYLESGGTVNYEDSTTVFTTIDVDSAVIASLDYDPPHGALNFSDSATVVALTQNTWAKLTGPGGDLFIVRDQDDMTIAGDSITIEVPGDYLLWVGVSFNGTQNAVFHIAVYKNGVATDWEMHRKTSAADTGNMGMPTYIQNLVAGDDLSLWIENTGNDGDATMVSGQVVITMLHPD